MNKLNNYIKMKKELFILKNINACCSSTIKEKELAVKDFTKKFPEYTFYEVCRAIKLSKGTYYNFLYRKKKKTSHAIRDEILTKEIIRICEETKNRLGSNKIRIELQKKRIHTSISKVAKILKDNNIGYRYTKPSKRQNETIHKNIFKRNLLKRHFFQNKPNAVWVSDFTEIKINSAKFYLCVILDLFSRKVIGYRLSCKLDLNLALKTFKDAYTSRGEPKNLMFHSDRGPQYMSHSFQDTLKALGVKQSLSDPATPYDNAVVESFFSNLKREEVYKREYVDYDDLVQSIDNYMDFYNNKRPHKALNYKTPTDFENYYYKLI